MKDKLKAWFDKLEPKQKKMVFLLMIITAISPIFLVGYNKREAKEAEDTLPVESRTVRFDEGDEELSLYQKALAELDQYRKDNLEIKRSLKTLRDELAKKDKDIRQNVIIPDIDEKKSDDWEPRINLPPPPKRRSESSNIFDPPKPLRKVAEKPQFIGGVRIIHQQADTIKTLKKKEKTVSVSLTPSFMPAMLLSGVAAPTTSEAQNNPIPMLFRIKAPAVLPNSVKKDVAGCFMLGSGIGKLNSERVEILLNSISCVDKDNKGIIYSDVQGYVVDNDGKYGLRGHVTAKMGLHIARTSFAAFVGGAGKAWSDSVKTTTLSSLGQTTTEIRDTDAETVVKAGVGEGIYEASQEMMKFYLQLAQQTLPVIEISPQREVTLVIQKPVELEIRDNLKNI